MKISFSSTKVLDLDLIFLDVFYGFGHDIIDGFRIFLTKFTFTNKQSLLTHTIMMFVFKAFVT